jgi:DNA polymerase-1
MKRVLLIDGDVWCYQIAAACEVPIQWDEDTWTLHSHFNEARDRLVERIAYFKAALNAESVHIALSSSPNFRFGVYPEYKSNRKAVRKPLCLPELKEYLTDIGVVYTRPTLEGDDVLGILATDPDFFPGYQKLIISIDKDLQTVPGFNLNEMHAHKMMTLDPSTTLEDYIDHTTDDEAQYLHLIQTLSGDPTDGYPGVPGCGLVTAKKLLDANRVLVKQTRAMKGGPRKGEMIEEWIEAEEESTNRWEIVKSVYASKGLSEEYALTMARCARILRHSDYNPKTQEIRLWGSRETLKQK